jgi:hypothetical protein
MAANKVDNLPHSYMRLFEVIERMDFDKAFRHIWDSMKLMSDRITLYEHPEIDVDKWYAKSYDNHKELIEYLLSIRDENKESCGLIVYAEYPASTTPNYIVPEGSEKPDPYEEADIFYLPANKAKGFNWIHSEYGIYNKHVISELTWVDALNCHVLPESLERYGIDTIAIYAIIDIVDRYMNIGRHFNKTFEIASQETYSSPEYEDYPSYEAFVEAYEQTEHFGPADYKIMSEIEWAMHQVNQGDGVSPLYWGGPSDGIQYEPSEKEINRLIKRITYLNELFYDGIKDEHITVIDMDWLKSNNVPLNIAKEAVDLGIDYKKCRIAGAREIE